MSDEGTNSVVAYIWTEHRGDSEVQPAQVRLRSVKPPNVHDTSGLS